jgi:hypothetical protein
MANTGFVMGLGLGFATAALGVALGTARATAFGFAVVLGFAVSAAVVLAGFLAAVATLDSFEGDGGEKRGADYAMFALSSNGCRRYVARVGFVPQRPAR